MIALLMTLKYALLVLDHLLLTEPVVLVQMALFLTAPQIVYPALIIAFNVQLLQTVINASQDIFLTDPNAPLVLQIV